jgi:hypothetical protein
MKLKISESFQDKFFQVNPALMPEHSIPVKIKRYYTDVNGTVVDKAAVSAAMQVKFPVYMLGQFDRNGGFKKSLIAVPPTPGTFYIMTYTVGINAPFLAFTGANNIKNYLQVGDVVQVYADDVENPNFFCWIIQSANPVSLSSVIANTETTMVDGRIGGLFIREFNLAVSDDSQYYEPFHFTKMDNIGNLRDDQVQPSMYFSPYTQQTGFLTIETMFKLDQYLGINFYMLYDVDDISLTFKTNKI